jgi:hypothetical protein
LSFFASDQLQLATLCVVEQYCITENIKCELDALEEIPCSIEETYWFNQVAERYHER